MCINIQLHALRDTEEHNHARHVSNCDGKRVEVLAVDTEYLLHHNRIKRVMSSEACRAGRWQERRQMRLAWHFIASKACKKLFNVQLNRSWLPKHLSTRPVIRYYARRCWAECDGGGFKAISMLENISSTYVMFLFYFIFFFCIFFFE